MNTVDIIVPCYLYAKFLEQSVRSVLDQDGVNVRVLIIDDASPDETPEVAGALVHEDARVSYIRHAHNKGSIRTYNEGIDWLSSAYYLLLSADDYLLPGALHRAVRVFEENPGVGLVFGSVVEDIKDSEPRTVRPIDQLGLTGNYAILEGTEFIRRSRARNIVPTPTAIVRTALQKKCGGYRMSLPHAGDMEMWFRLAARGQVGVIADAQAVYRRHGANMSLAYLVESGLPDYRQRQEALELFFRESATYITDSKALHNDSMRELANQALAEASAHYNGGRMALSHAFEEYALSLSADVRGSEAWRRLRLKRAIGPLASRLARSLMGRGSA